MNRIYHELTEETIPEDFYTNENYVIEHSNHTADEWELSGWTDIDIRKNFFTDSGILKDIEMIQNLEVKQGSDIIFYYRYYDKSLEPDEDYYYLDINDLSTFPHDIAVNFDSEKLEYATDVGWLPAGRESYLLLIRVLLEELINEHPLKYRYKKSSPVKDGNIIVDTDGAVDITLSDGLLPGDRVTIKNNGSGIVTVNTELHDEILKYPHPGMDNQQCHAFNNGQCMNGFTCGGVVNITEEDILHPERSIKLGDRIHVEVKKEYHESFNNVPLINDGEVWKIDDEHVWVKNTFVNRYPFCMIDWEFAEPTDRTYTHEEIIDRRYWHSEGDTFLSIDGFSKSAHFCSYRLSDSKSTVVDKSWFTNRKHQGSKS